jgi:site-specific recombinase XerD
MASLHKRSNGVYSYITYINGRHVWRSTGSRSKKEAERIIASNFKEKKKQAPRLTLSMFSVKFLVYANTNLAHGTVLLYEQADRVFIRLLGDRNLDDYTLLDVEAFKAKRLGEVSAVKVNIDFRTLRALFQTALRWKFIIENPFHGVKQIRVPAKRPSYFTKEDLDQVLQHTKLPWFKDLIVFSVCTMMRAGEIVSLKWDSVDLRRRLILIENTNEFRTKTLKPRAIPMNEWVFRFLATRENKVGCVFASPDIKKLRVGYISHRFKKYVRAAGLSDDLHFHSLRHTGATWLVQGGVSIYAVQKILGHASISTTQVYSHLETENLFQYMEQIKPPEKSIQSLPA